MSANVLRLSDDRYHSLPQVSRSQIETFLESRWLFYQRHVLRIAAYESKSTPQMEFGTWWHARILEHADYLVIPADVLNADGERRGKQWKEFRDRHAGEHLVTSDEVFQIRQMEAAIRDNVLAAELLGDQDDREVESTLTWQDEVSGEVCRGRLDLVIPGRSILDLKTIRDCSLHTIETTIESSGYYRQAGYYQWAWFALTGETLPFTLVFSETSCPWRCRVVELDQAWIDRGLSECKAALSQIASCRRSGQWRDPDSYQSEPIVMAAPGWSKGKWRLEE
mgnify:CR=1 FL=1